MSTHSQKKKPAVVLTLGGGANRGVSHLGFLQFFEEHEVPVKSITGVSIGSIVATMYLNGVPLDTIKRAFVEDISFPPLFTAVRAILPSLNPLRILGVVDLIPLMSHLVEKYNLKPQPGLRMTAYDVLRLESVVFEGLDYDLTLALAASCSVPGLMRPVYVNRDGKRRLLVDGGVHHPHPGSPGEISKGSGKGTTTIVSKLIGGSLVDTVYPNGPNEHVVAVSNDVDDFFGRLSESEVARRASLGYSQTKAALTVSHKGVVRPRS